MDTRNKITISWSGGKDSALALHNLLRDERFEVVHIHTVIDADSGRVGLHGVREEMVERQARQLGFELVKGYLKTQMNYEDLMKEMYEAFRLAGITHIMFGDIFLEDLRSYRERLVRKSGLVPVFPLWKKDSVELIREFVDAGFKTVVCAANEKCHKAGILGKTLDQNLLEGIPDEIDRCGENGEFHTFVFDGPIFDEPVPLALGQVVSKSYDYNIIENGVTIRKTTAFFFQDILP